MQHGDQQHGGLKPLPLNVNIVVAWEMPNDPTRSLYVYGSGTYTQRGKDDYTFNVQLIDTLPKFVLKNFDTTNAIAAGHVFLLSNMTTKNGDTLRQNCNWDSLQVVGSMNGIGVIFTKGSPTLAGKNLMGIPQGFNLFFATRWDMNQSVTDFLPVHDPSAIDIQVDDSGDDCRMKTPLWLQ